MLLPKHSSDSLLSGAVSGSLTVHTTLSNQSLQCSCPTFMRLPYYLLTFEYFSRTLLVGFRGISHRFCEHCYHKNLQVSL